MSCLNEMIGEDRAEEGMKIVHLLNLETLISFVQSAVC